MSRTYTMEQLARIETERDEWHARAENLRVALEESLKLQSHYASLLNMHDGGRRIGFSSVAAWIARLRETGTLPPAGDVSNLPPL